MTQFIRSELSFEADEQGFTIRYRGRTVGTVCATNQLTGNFVATQDHIDRAKSILDSLAAGLGPAEYIAVIKSIDMELTP